MKLSRQTDSNFIFTLNRYYSIIITNLDNCSCHGRDTTHGVARPRDSRKWSNFSSGETCSFSWPPREDRLANNTSYWTNRRNDICVIAKKDPFQQTVSTSSIHSQLPYTQFHSTYGPVWVVPPEKGFLVMHKASARTYT
jgi:hypothetical protein